LRKFIIGRVINQVLFGRYVAMKQMVDELEALNGYFFYFSNKKETGHCQLLGIVIEHAILYVEAMKIGSSCDEGLSRTKDEKKESTIAEDEGREERVQLVNSS
jgi:hypothetical protein